MSYNVIAEAAGPLDWSRLQSAVSAIQRAVEVFPIPAESPDEVDAVGISIPVDQADERAWEELMGLLDMFRLKFDMKAFELYSGLAFDPSTIGRIRQNFLG